MDEWIECYINQSHNTVEEVLKIIDDAVTCGLELKVEDGKLWFYA